MIVIKQAIVTLLLILINVISHAQKNTDPGILKKANEQVLFSFRIKSNGKIATVCVDKSKNYLVYRFGSKDKIELQYPAMLDRSSWRLFKYRCYSRGGGKANDAQELHSLTFTNQSTMYEVYDNSNINEGTITGILLTIGKGNIGLSGDIRSKKGTLGSLRDYTDLIPNSYWDE